MWLYIQHLNEKMFVSITHSIAKALNLDIFLIFEIVSFAIHLRYFIDVFFKSLFSKDAFFLTNLLVTVKS